MLPIASGIPCGTGFLRTRCAVEERYSNAAKDGGKGCENAGADDGSTGQAQGNLRSHMSREYVPFWMAGGTDMCATTITL